MHTLLLALAAISGDISQESIYEPEHDDPWVHHRTRLHLYSKSEDKVLGDSGILWSYEASNFVQYDAALDPDDRLEWRSQNFLVKAYRHQWNARVGWQTVNWGETLGPSLIDLVNPRDLRDASDWLRGDRKLAVPLVLVGWTYESAMIEAWAAPFTSQSKLPESWQSIPLANNDRSDIPEYGLRAGTLLSGWDMKVYALRHRSRLPSLALEIKDFQPTIQAAFPLQTTLGFTVSQAWDNLVLRSEYVHAETDDWPDDSALDFAVDQVVVGLDGNWGDHFFWGTEYRYQNAGWMIAQGRWNLWDDRVKPVVYLMQRIGEHDAYQRYEVTTDLPKNWTAGLSWEAFQSGKTGYFQQLMAYDRLGISLQWEF